MVVVVMVRLLVVVELSVAQVALTSNQHHHQHFGGWVWIVNQDVNGMKITLINRPKTLVLNLLFCLVLTNNEKCATA